MPYVHALFAVVFALLITVVTVGFIGWRHPRAPGGPVAALFLFLLLFPAIWAGGVWLQPFGPPLWGAHWLPFLVIGLFVVSLVLAFAAPERPGRAAATSVQDRAPGAPGVVATAWFWLVWVLFVVAVVLSYLA